MKNSKLSIIVLHDDHSYKIIEQSKINPRELKDDHIEMILIPCFDRENVYIPMKPSIFYDFSKVRVEIRHNVFMFDMEEVTGEELSSLDYVRECFNIIELGNALFNLYKFRGTSIFLSESINMDSGITVTYTDYPIRIQLTFYDENLNVLKQIDSKPMKTFSSRNLEDYLAYPPQYCFEDRFACLEDMLYVPLNTTFRPRESDYNGLPSIIALRNSKKWKCIYKINKDVEEDDLLLQKIPDYECYYLMPEELYFQLERLRICSFYYSMGSIPIDGKYNKNYMPTLKKSGKVIPSEKEELYQDLLDGNVISIIPIDYDIGSMEIFLTLYAFSHIILAYMKYFTSLVYGYEDRDAGDCIYTFISFSTHMYGSTSMDRVVLLDTELTPDSLTNAIVKILRA